MLSLKSSWVRVSVSQEYTLTQGFTEHHPRDKYHQVNYHKITLNNLITTSDNVAQQDEIAALVALKEKDPGSGQSSESDSSDSEVVSFLMDCHSCKM